MDSQRSMGSVLILLLLLLVGFSSRAVARSSGLLAGMQEHEGEILMKGHRNISKEEVVMDTGRNPCIQVEPNECSSWASASTRRMALVRRSKLAPPPPTSNQPTSYTKHPQSPPY